ncbi:MAG TPA: hypothetical protein VF774_29315 [Pseudoduganella sp.]|jgi:hypothetical protein
MHLQLMAAVAALAFTGAASAQSHSVSNMANPPQAQSDNKAATEATPGRTATAHQNSNKQKDKNAGQTRNAPKAGGKAQGKAETSGSSVTGERDGAGTSATATTGTGAGNGDQGAEGAMEIKPSEAYTNPVERHALDEAPKSGQK